MSADYQLIYWPTIQGRGEFIRLVLEDAGIPYIDLARLPESQGGGFPAVLKYAWARNPEEPVWAPPLLRVKHQLLSQTPNILWWLGKNHGYWPRSDELELLAMQIQLTIFDLVAEIHDTHHPIAHDGHYEEQIPAAKMRSAQFLETRLPRFLNYLETLLIKNGGVYMIGKDVSTIDLSTFQVLEGLEYAFPKGFATASHNTPRLHALRDRIRQRPRLSAYLASERRVPFNEHGIFRRYPELDLRP